MASNRRTAARTPPADSGLSESLMDRDPIVQFGQWYEAAQATGLIEPTAMALATASRDGTPSVRMVLLKGYDQRGFVFYTNYESPKARDLLENPRAALVFWWGAFQRQIRVSGEVTRVTDAESDAYFASRPLGSRLGAVASRQSATLTSRDELERTVTELAAMYGDAKVPRPKHWGGFRIAPATIEFWQGRANRLHDRLRYSKVGAGGWKIERLSP
jgi:pyridoxamine 5'-phosphate oxidase